MNETVGALRAMAVTVTVSASVQKSILTARGWASRWRSVSLFFSWLFIFLIGILSEQVSSLHYKKAEEDHRRTLRGPR